MIDKVHDGSALKCDVPTISILENCISFLSVTQVSDSDLGRLVVEVSRLQIIRRTHARTVGLLCTSDQLAAEAATYPTHNKKKQTNFHALSGVRTRDPPNQATLDLTP
jgi:hypothetical protein